MLFLWKTEMNIKKLTILNKCSKCQSDLINIRGDFFCLVYIIKVCQTQSADLSVFVLFFLLSYFSLPPSASLDFSLISQPISMKFGMLIVLDETIGLGVGTGRGPKVYYAL